jgi:hypothetical protein
MGRGRYWAFGRTSEALDELLSDEDCPLEKLLSEEDLLQEVRNMNTKAID